MIKTVLDQGEKLPKSRHRDDFPAIFGNRWQRPSLLGAISLVGFYLFSSLWIASHRLFWYDEISTVILARLPDCATIWQAIVHAADVLPPGYFLLVRLFDQVLGPTEMAARIPSALAMAAGLLIIFDCARRLTDNLHALGGLALLSCSLLPYYGYEARPYALYFMLVAIELWLWVHTPDQGWSPFLFGVTVFLAFNLHYYSALCLVPYAALEASRWQPWRAPSRKLFAGGLGLLCGVAELAYPILGARKVSPGFWAPPSFGALREMFGEFFPFGVFVAAAVLIWITWTAAQEKVTLSSMLAGERVGWFFLLIPGVGYIAAKLVTNAFFNRYFIGILPGVAVAFSCALWRHYRHRPSVSAGIVVLMLLFGVGPQISATVHPSKIEPPSDGRAPARMKEVLAMESTLMRDGKTIIALPADHILGVEARYYSKHPENYAFVVTPHLGVVGRVHLNLAHYHPMRFWNLEELCAHARETALVDPSEDMLKAMTGAGFQIKSLATKEVKIVYLE
jgi:Dolichyl-phosphate-mannose-protein mannosyltransferase